MRITSGVWCAGIDSCKSQRVVYFAILLLNLARMVMSSSMSISTISLQFVRFVTFRVLCFYLLKGCFCSLCWSVLVRSEGVDGDPPSDNFDFRLLFFSLFSIKFYVVAVCDE